jgi:hypothetical protein
MAPVDKFGKGELERLRVLSCSEVLPLLCTFVKMDPDFTPIKNGHTERWHLNVQGRDFELLTTGPKFFDTHTKTGGGGAIDLAMHLTGLTFKQAVKLLKGLM